jgi:hypothetical protein
MPNEQDTIDINDPQLQSEMVEANPDANFFDPPPPPPDDRELQMVITVSDEGPSAKKSFRRGDPEGKPSGPLVVSFPLILRVVDPGQPWDNIAVYDNASSNVSDNKGTSRLHTILRALGAPALGAMSLAQLRDHAANVFSTEPTAWVEGEWEARVEDPKARGGYRTACRGMKNFPKDESKPSGYDHIFVDSKAGKVAARYRVNNYLIR